VRRGDRRVVMSVRECAMMRDADCQARSMKTNPGCAKW